MKRFISFRVAQGRLEDITNVLFLYLIGSPKDTKDSLFDITMSSPKKQKFCGFSTASEFMNCTNNAVGGGGVTYTTTNDERRQEVSNSTTNNNMFMESRETTSMKTDESPVMRRDTDSLSNSNMFMERETIPTGGFSTAKEFMESIPTKSEETTAPLLQPGQSSYDVILTVRGLQYHKENLESLESLSLHRDVKNLYGKLSVL